MDDSFILSIIFILSSHITANLRCRPDRGGQLQRIVIRRYSILHLSLHVAMAIYLQPQDEVLHLGKYELI